LELIVAFQDFKPKVSENFVQIGQKLANIDSKLISSSNTGTELKNKIADVLAKIKVLKVAI